MYHMDSNNEQVDRHASQRDNKAEKRRRDKPMRGNRSVFTVQDVIAKKGKKAREK